MKNYLLKRLFIGFFTFFGIIVFTFLIIQLTPGDPASLKLSGVHSGGQKLAREIITETRHLYGLDKPILVHFPVRDRDEIIFKILEQDSPDTGKILQTGTAAIPALIQALQDESYIKVRPGIVWILQNLALRWNPPPDLLKPGVEPEKWVQFVDGFLSTFSDTLINRLAWSHYHAISLGEKYSTERSLVNIGTYGAKIWMPHLLTLTGKKEWASITQLAGKIFQKPWRVGADAEREEQKRILKRWKDWWNGEHYRYVRISWKDRLVSVVTQTRFWTWLRRVVTLDLGDSFSYRRPVVSLIAERLPVTLQLNIISIFLVYLFSIPLGVFSATHQGQLSDRVCTTFLFILYSLPTFWVAEMLILFTTGGSFFNVFPSHYLHSTDASSMDFLPYLKDWIMHLILPVFCLTYGGIAYLSKQMRAGMLESIRQDYIRTAKAKGLSRFDVIYRHALRNGLIPIITLVGYLLPGLLGGSVIIEEIFSLNGIGKLSFESVFNRDYPVVMALALISSLLTLVGLLISDVLYVWIDPRIRFDEVDI